VEATHQIWPIPHPQVLSRSEGKTVDAFISVVTQETTYRRCWCNAMGYIRPRSTLTDSMHNESGFAVADHRSGLPYTTLERVPLQEVFDKKVCIDEGTFNRG
jgi:hypothetical protein